MPAPCIFYSFITRSVFFLPTQLLGFSSSSSFPIQNVTPFQPHPPQPWQVPTASSLIMMMIPYTLPLEHYLGIAPPTLGGSLDRTGDSVPILQMKKQVQVSSQSHVIGKSSSLD